MNAPGADRRARFGDALGRARGVIRRNVERHGFHIAGVVSDADEGAEPLFAYTIGLEVTFGHPELLVVVAGMPYELAYDVLHAAVWRIRAGKRYTEGEHDDVIQHGYTVYVRPVPRSPVLYDELFGQLVDAYESRDFTVLQLVLPDEHRRFPWHAGCDPAFVRTQDGAAIGVDLRAPRAN
jgi:Domain of unknown function (DUF4262)